MELAHTEPRPEPTSLIAGYDGTRNEISENICNVLKLYRCLPTTPRPAC
ncbi:protein of unknown function [Bradyrhizobium vignae]|uniref:Uncharacterized protein n=1 Tax=Bradyrhizobium vignae TaxID=1549949 RepID=A0A2U3PRJ4_9BRAD|nr:hypothetical protein [Bradyrhizobium vignae]SPP91771.1 protein of unknown function [Bradyrhizobium vignae]